MSFILTDVTGSVTFRLEDLAPGQRKASCLEVETDEEIEAAIDRLAAVSGLGPSTEIFRREVALFRKAGRLSLPVLATRGISKGNTLLITAGVHGDEYEGMEAIYRIFDALDPLKLTGNVVALPIVTPPAFWFATRINPVDGKDLARCFPGSRTGTLSERIADLLVRQVFPLADAYVDLHSAGRSYQSLTFCGFVGCGAVGRKSRDLAICFGAPVVWEHDQISAGRTLTSSLEMGIPSLYVEALGGGQTQARDLEIYSRGLANVLRELGIVELPQPQPPDESGPLYLTGSGDLDKGVTASCSGLFISELQAGARVQAGEELGLIRGMDGKVLARPVSPSTGIIVFHRTSPRIFAGEMVSLVAQIDK